MVGRARILMLAVYAQATGQSVPLKQVADIEVVWEPAKIIRRYRLRTVTVSSSLRPGYTAFQVLDQITPWLEQESANRELGIVGS